MSFFASRPFKITVFPFGTLFLSRLGSPQQKRTTPGSQDQKISKAKATFARDFLICEPKLSICLLEIKPAGPFSSCVWLPPKPLTLLLSLLVTVETDENL